MGLKPSTNTFVPTWLSQANEHAEKRLFPPTSTGRAKGRQETHTEMS